MEQKPVPENPTTGNTYISETVNKKGEAKTKNFGIIPVKNILTSVSNIKYTVRKVNAIYGGKG